jgi:hypothetical protein
MAHHQDRRGYEYAQFENHMWNPRLGGHDDREGCSLSLEGSGPKAFESNVHNAQVHDASGHRTTSSSMMARQTLAFS